MFLMLFMKLIKLMKLMTRLTPQVSATTCLLFSLGQAWALHRLSQEAYGAGGDLNKRFFFSFSFDPKLKKIIFKSVL